MLVYLFAAYEIIRKSTLLDMQFFFLLNKVATSTRDEALLSTNAMREKLNNFEGTLKGVSEEILRVLERKEAVLQGVEAERKQERAAYDEGV